MKEAAPAKSGARFLKIVLRAGGLYEIGMGLVLIFFYRRIFSDAGGRAGDQLPDFFEDGRDFGAMIGMLTGLGIGLALGRIMDLAYSMSKGNQAGEQAAKDINPAPKEDTSQPSPAESDIDFGTGLEGKIPEEWAIDLSSSSSNKSGASREHISLQSENSSSSRQPIKLDATSFFDSKYIVADQAFGSRANKLISAYELDINDAADLFEIRPSYIKGVIYEEQSHLMPPIIEDWIPPLDIFGRKIGQTVGLGQITIEGGWTREQLRDPMTNIYNIAGRLNKIISGQPNITIEQLGTRYNNANNLGVSQYGIRYGYYVRMFEGE